MTRRHGKQRALGALMGAAVLLAASAAAAGSARGLFYERTLMLAADQRCDLFTPQLSSALDAARAQARGAALRAGDESSDLDQVAQRARAKASAVACGSGDLTLAAQRVRDAFAGFSRLQKMRYPGDLSAWQADRTAGARTMTWRLSQPASFGWDQAVFGIGGLGGATQMMAVASFADGAWPYAARLVLRDPARAPRPQIARLASTTGAQLPLARRMTPRTASRVILANNRAMAEPLMLPKGAKDGVMFLFPAEAARRMQGLDPREAVAVEFLFAGEGPDQIRTAYVEVGDFAAGQAFLRVSQR